MIPSNHTAKESIVIKETFPVRNEKKRIQKSFRYRLLDKKLKWNNYYLLVSIKLKKEFG